MYPGAINNETNYGPGGVLVRETITACDLSGEITVTEAVNGVATVSRRPRTAAEIAAGDRAVAKQAMSDKRDADVAIVTRSAESAVLAKGASGENMSGPEQTELLRELADAVLALAALLVQQ